MGQWSPTWRKNKETQGSLHPLSPSRSAHLREDTSNDRLCSSNGSTKSLSDHTFQEIFEYGRRYCNDTYLLPNDDSEQTRLDIINQVYLILLDGQLSICPIPPTIARILDVGSGNADWAIAAAEQFPDAEVIATDVNVFESHHVDMAPSNVLFQIDDVEEEWTYNEPFDVIHARSLACAISDWPAFYTRAFRHLKPGGILCVADADLTSECLRIPNDPPNSYMSIYLSALRSASDTAGYPRGIDHVRFNVLSAAGFTNIRVVNMEVPIGTWPTDARGKTMGKMGIIAALESLEAMSMRVLTKYAGWTPEDVLDLCDKVKIEVVTWQGATCMVRFAVATKPE